MYSEDIKKVIDEYYKLTDYKNPYNNLNKSNERQQQVCELLENFLTRNDLNDELTMWAYWNISDNYALQRKANETYNNHKKFEDYLKDKELKYKLLLLVDSTQRLTLINGGYGEYWDNLYFNIMNKIVIDEFNVNIVFNVLRTATYNHQLNTNESLKKDALDKMKLIINMFDNSPMINWFKLGYYCSLIPYNLNHNINNKELIEESFNLFKIYEKILKVNNKEERLKDYHNTSVLMGSYEDWNKEIDEYRQARFIQNLIIQYIDCEYYNYAKAAYELIGSNEFESKYFKTKVRCIIS
ncbi:MAG: hypothetical protein IJX78_07600 [Bacilli bacterium]|nr:hypothetical protein [Bacilli bacterium]